VGFGAIGFVAAYGEIINSNSLNSAFRQVVGGGLRDVYELFLERVCFPVVGGILGLEENALAFLQMMGLELVYLDELGMPDGDYSRRADGCFDGHGLHAFSVGQEMARRVHVGADVRAG